MVKNVPCVSSSGKKEQNRGVGENDYSPCIAHLSLSPTPHASECQFLYSEKKKTGQELLQNVYLLVRCTSTAKCIQEKLTLNEQRRIIIFVH